MYQLKHGQGIDDDDDDDDARFGSSAPRSAPPKLHLVLQQLAMTP